jgi:hypothetical protein
MFPLDHAMRRKAASRESELNDETHHNRKKGSVIERKGKIVEGAAEYMRNPGWKAASVFLDDVERKGGGHDPDQASKRLSPKRVRTHAVLASYCS